jgi:hypothetical protein
MRFPDTEEKEMVSFLMVKAETVSKISTKIVIYLSV